MVGLARLKSLIYHDKKSSTQTGNNGLEIVALSPKTSIRIQRIIYFLNAQ